MYEKQNTRSIFSLRRSLLPVGLVLISCLLPSFVLTGCTGPTVTTGAFREVSRLENELHRGVSTKRDVQRVLGAPNGFGGSVLPTNPRPHEVWFYDDIVVTGTQMETGGFIRANMRQQILLIFFDEGVFDGYMWYSNAGAATSK